MQRTTNLPEYCRDGQNANIDFPDMDKQHSGSSCKVYIIEVSHCRPKKVAENIYYFFQVYEKGVTSDKGATIK